MKTEMLTKAGRFLSKAGLQIKKHSPEILMGVGIVGTVASTVLACKATLKVNEILEEKNNTVEAIHKCLEDESLPYTEEDSKKDLTIVYTQTGVKLAKLYAPAIAVGALSITSIVAGHKILKARNIAIAAAYAAVDKGFKDYRKRVVERFGEQLDKELRYNVKATEVEEKTVDEKGKEKVEKKIVNTVNPEDLSQISEFARFFDESCPDWRKDSEFNLMYLRRQQDWANEKLKQKGHLFLNEVYDMLGINRTRAGQVVGWIYDENNDKGDNFVDFGIYDINSERKRAFVNGDERSILLDFNVDGVIYDKI